MTFRWITALAAAALLLAACGGGDDNDRTKGDIARSIFYFYTRYYRSRPTDFSLGNFNVEEATLRRWHESDPPDADEISHNDLVYAIQGNRNPYIDHPEYLKEIPDFPDR